MSFINTLLHNYQDHMARQRNLPFLRATMAACAMVASADGDVSFAERVRLDQILETLDRLKVFDPHEGVNLFDEFTDAILAHSEEGHALAMQALIDGTPEPPTRELLVRICLAVSEMNAGPDGKKALADQIEIVTLCNRLGVDPRNCGLYVDDPDFPNSKPEAS